MCNTIKQELLSALTLRDRQILGLYFYYGFTELEIAKIYGVSQRRVGQIKDRAIEKAKDVYERFEV